MSHIGRTSHSSSSQKLCIVGWLLCDCFFPVVRLVSRACYDFCFCIYVVFVCARVALCSIHPMRALFLIPRNQPPRLKSRKWWGLLDVCSCLKIRVSLTSIKRQVLTKQTLCCRVMCFSIRLFGTMCTWFFCTWPLVVSYAYDDVVWRHRYVSACALVLLFWGFLAGSFFFWGGGGVAGHFRMSWC